MRAEESKTAHVLETRRLALRTWNVADAEASFAIHGDPRVTALQQRAPYANVGEAHARIVQQRALIEARGFGHWAMVEREGNELVGSCGFRAVEGAPVLEIGFTVAPSRWGRGYGVEVVTGCIGHAFERLGALRVIALTNPANLPAQRVLERARMRPTGESVVEGTLWRTYAIDPGDVPSTR